MKNRRYAPIPVWASGTVEYASYAPKDIKLKTKSDAASVLLLNDKYDPGWQVFLRNKLTSPVNIGETQVVNVWGDYSSDSWDLPTTNL